MHRRFISVPVNSAGIEEYDYGVDESENLLLFLLPDEEAKRLWDIFDIMNIECDLFIDDCESEIIPQEDLEKCKDLVDDIKEDIPVFYGALLKAIEYGTMLGLDF